MTGQKSHKVPLGILRKLESAIANQIPEHLSLIHELADLLNVSKESIYRRLRGTTAFSFNELWLLFQTYGISIDTLFNNISRESYNIRFFSVKEIGVLPYCHKVQEIYGDFVCNQNQHIYIISSQIPLFSLLERQYTLRFKQTIWSHKYNVTDEIDTRNKSGIPQQHLKGMGVRHIIWSSNATRHIIKELEYALSCGIVFDDDFVYGFLNDLISIVQARVLSNSNQRVILYEQELETNMNVMLEYGGIDAICIQLGDDVVAVTSGGSEVSNHRIWIDAVLSQCVRITGQSDRQKRSFYLKLTEPIYQLANRMLPVNLVKKLRSQG